MTAGCGALGAGGDRRVVCFVKKVAPEDADTVQLFDQSPRFFIVGNDEEQGIKCSTIKGSRRQEGRNCLNISQERGVAPCFANLYRKNTSRDLILSSVMSSS